MGQSEPLNECSVLLVKMKLPPFPNSNLCLRGHVLCASIIIDEVEASWGLMSVTGGKKNSKKGPRKASGTGHSQLLWRVEDVKASFEEETFE